jgi:tRNA (cmo5U34)-methyltransferase
MASLIDKFGSSNRFYGVEVSQPMLAACRERFQDMINHGIVNIRDEDLRKSYPPVRASVTLCVLTLMFTPVDHRFEILSNAFEHTLPDGIFILVEKILGVDTKIDKFLVELYHEHKRAMGYTKEEIDRKRLSLEGVLVPVTVARNEELLRSAGFSHIEPFWRCLNFCAWIAIKD